MNCALSLIRLHICRHTTQKNEQYDRLQSEPSSLQLNVVTPLHAQQSTADLIKLMSGLSLLHLTGHHFTRTHLKAAFDDSMHLKFKDKVSAVLKAVKRLINGRSTIKVNNMFATRMMSECLSVSSATAEYNSCLKLELNLS